MEKIVRPEIETSGIVELYTGVLPYVLLSIMVILTAAIVFFVKKR